MTITALHLLAVAAGGAIGGIARVWVAGLVTRRFGDRFPWGTLVVNVSGAALIGVAAGLSLAQEEPVGVTVSWALLVVGVLGSYTTVSAFSLQTLTLLREGGPGRAATNIAASIALCLGAAAAGWLGASWIVRA